MENFWPTFMHQQQYFFSASNIILAISKGWLELKDALYIFYFPFQLAFFSGKLIPSWILSRRWPYLFHIVSWFAFNLIAFWIRLKSLKDLDHEMLNAMKRLTHTEKMSAVTEKAWLILIPEMFLSFCEWNCHYFMGLFQTETRRLLTEFSLRAFLSDPQFILLNQRPLLSHIDVKISEDIAAYCNAFPRIAYFAFAWPINTVLYSLRLIQNMSPYVFLVIFVHFILFQGGLLFIQLWIRYYFDVYYHIRPSYMSIHEIYMTQMDEIEMAHGKPVILQKMNFFLSQMNHSLIRIQSLKGIYSLVQLLYKKTSFLMNHVVVFLFAPRGATNHYELLKYVKDFSMILNQFPEILNQYGAYQASVKMITALFEAFEKETQIINQDVEFTKRKLHNEAKQESILKILPYSKEAVTETAAKGALIEFKHVTIATPLVDPETPRRVLFEDLHFSLPPRKNLLIMGPSGIGKTSIYRTLFGLWTPLKGSVIFRYEDIVSNHGRIPRYMKLPSAPLLPASNLTEQLLFPNLLREYKGSKSLLELRIQQVLKKLRLTHLSHRFQGFSEISFEDWHSLSNGEKQRIGFARLFLAQDLPIYTFKLAFLDESSSSIDPKMEQIIYEECKRKNIQLVSIEHRENISNHYDFLLKLNTNRTVSFTELGPHDQAVVNQTSLLGEIEKEKADCSYVSILGWLCVSTIVVLF